MDFLEKFQSLVLFIVIVLGLLFGQNKFIADFSDNLIVPFLFLMLLGVFLSIDIKDFYSNLNDFNFIKVSLLINFIWTPFLAYLLGFLFLNNYPELWIGFIMLLVTPCTDWYLIFTDMSNGNLELSLSILPLNLILQIILLPVYLLLFSDVSGNFDINILLESIVYIIALPFVISVFIKGVLKNKSVKDRIIRFFNRSQILFLSLAIFCMFASHGKLLIYNIKIVSYLLIPLLLFFIINFILVRMIGKTTKISYKNYVSLSLTTLARNSPMSLAIAVTAFSNKPIIGLVLVIAPLIELPVLIIVSRVLLKTEKRY